MTNERRLSPDAPEVRRTGASLRANRGRLLGLFLAVLVPLAVFGHLAEDVWTRDAFSWDLPVLLAIHRYAGPVADPWMVLVTRLGMGYGTLPLAGIAVAALLHRSRIRDAAYVAFAFGGAAVIDVIVKNLFRRTRPHLWPSPAPEYDFGFPSGHAMLTTALVVALCTVAWRSRARIPVLLAGAAFLVAVDLSRVYLGVHYPSDVVAGTAAALAWSAGLAAIFFRRSPELPPGAGPVDSPATMEPG